MQHLRAGSSSARARSMACDTFSSERKNRRYARFSSRTTPGSKPLRCNPTLFSPYSLHRVAHRLEVGRNVLGHARAAPDEGVPCRCARTGAPPHSPEMIARSSTVTWPASCTPLAMITPSPSWQSCARCTYDIMKQFAHRGLHRKRRAAVDRRVLAHDRVLTDLDGRLLALELEVLRIATEHRAHADAHPACRGARCAPASRAARSRSRRRSRSRADDREGADLHVRAQSAHRGHDRSRVDARAHRSRTIAAMSASPPPPVHRRHAAHLAHVRRAPGSPARNGAGRRASPAGGTSRCRAT
jgi:hypothetical protein